MVEAPQPEVRPTQRSVYDLLHALVDAGQWHTETEVQEYHNAITDAESKGVFGNSGMNLRTEQR